MNINKIIYIAGYGRSGSTILDILLGMKTNIFSGGELTYLLNHYFSDRCSCGKIYENCALWSNIKFYINIEEYKKLVDKCDKKMYCSSEDFSKYFKYLEVLFNAISEYDKNIDTVVDSSKNSSKSRNRINMYIKNGYNVKIIHIYRPLTKVLKSVSKGRNWDIEKGKNKYNIFYKLYIYLRTIMGWSLANVSAMVYGKKYKNNYLFFDYERFLKDPNKVIEALSYFVEEDLTKEFNDLKGGTYLKDLHIVGGNRLKYSKFIKFETKKGN